jgi:hypothetical protein
LILSIDSGPRPTIVDQPSFAVRKRSAFEMTETELIVIAALAIIGLNSNPKKG